MDGNNQYGNAMTKPLPVDCIKKAYTACIRELLILLEGISQTDKIGHLSIVDLEFNLERAT